MRVVTAVDEADIGEVAAGQSATFTVSAYPERTFEGVVTEVRNSPTIVQDVVTYGAVVEVQNKDLLLKPGMTASVKIRTAQAKDVTRAPTVALRFVLPGSERPEGEGLWVLSGGQVSLVPVTVDNFLAYVRSGFYVGTVFHRVVPGFVVQGGGYAQPLAVGDTLPTVKTPGDPIALEDNAGLSNLQWTVAMARTQVLNSANSQFFVNLVDNSFLDRSGSSRGYAVFGKLTAGTDFVTAMVAAPCSAWPAFFGNTSTCLPVPNLVITAASQTR